MEEIGIFYGEDSHKSDDIRVPTWRSQIPGWYFHPAGLGLVNGCSECCVSMAAEVETPLFLFPLIMTNWWPAQLDEQPYGSHLGKGVGLDAEQEWGFEVCAETVKRIFWSSFSCGCQGNMKQILWLLLLVAVSWAAISKRREARPEWDYRKEGNRPQRSWPSSPESRLLLGTTETCFLYCELGWKGTWLGWPLFAKGLGTPVVQGRIVLMAHLLLTVDAPKSIFHKGR